MSLSRRFLESLAHPLHHSEAWGWIADQQEHYPADVNLAPYRRPRKVRPPAKLTSIRLTRYGKNPRAESRGFVLELFDERGQQLHLLPDGPDQAEQLKAAVFTQANRGRLLIFANEAGSELRQLWDSFALPLAQLGFVLEPVGNTTNLIALRVVRSKQLWTFCDAKRVTGVPLNALRRQNRVLGGKKGTYSVPIARLWHTLTWLQHELWSRFGVGFELTIGGAAVKAASFHLPEQAWLWRPNPLMIAMLRAGGGFRGGHIRAETYSGPASHIDVRRMYTAALSKPLPLRVSFGPWYGPEQKEGGIYLCTITGQGRHPVYLSRWAGPTKGFEAGLWHGGECVAMLTTDEIGPLARLGYTVLPGWGFGFWRTFTLRSYVQQLQELTSKHGAKSAIGLLCKALGNHVWGKWAQSPHRWDLAFSLERPGDDYLPFTDDQGDEQPYLWTRYITRYRYTQHIELAAAVTAHGRAQLYTMVADLLDGGYRPIKENTDAIWIRGQPPPGILGETDTIGDWRLEGYDEHFTCLRTGAYIFGGVGKRPGSSRSSPAIISELFAKEAAANGSDPLELARLLRTG